LLAIGDWLRTNGEGIYGTRPWKIFGEGPTGVAEGHLSENKNKPFTAEDIRYTQDGKYLYAAVLDWPKNNKLIIRTLNSEMKVGTKGIASIKLLGSRENLKWTRDANGLTITLPVRKPGDYAYVFKISPKGKLIME
jgi:alpha-L-fucosidase